MKKLIFVLFGVISLFARANDDITFSSFGALGMTMSDSERYGYRPTIGYDKGVFDGDVDFLSRSLVGGQIDWNFSPDIDFVGQFVIRDMTEPRLEDYVSLAFLRYTPSSNWTFRIGRTVADLFLITEFRNINFAYNWATVPPEVYGMIPYQHVDGLDVEYTTRFSGGTLSTKIFTGVSAANIPTALGVEDLKIEDIVGFSTKFEKNDWVIHARHSQVRASNEGVANQLLIHSINQIPSVLWPNAPAFSDMLRFKGSKLKFMSVGFQSYIDQFLFSAEVSRVNSTTPVIPQITSGYGSLSYQAQQHNYFALAAFVNADNYEFTDSEVVKSVFPELVSTIELLGNFYAFNQKSLSLGWRWNINNNVASTVQISRSFVEGNGGTLWINNSLETPKETINSLFLNVSWAF